MESLPYSGTSKRAKAPAGSIAQTAHCLVDGCTADLNLCRDYHRRHKVCEAHSKTPLVKISGREQRFCQQCSRFHSLVEFDEGKRSCRKRLDGHNRRRRKPQPDSRTAPPGLIFSAQQSMPTARLLSFTSPQMLPTAVGNSWPGIVKPENEMSMPSYNNHHHYQQLNYVERPGQFSDHAFHEHAFADPTPSASPNIVSGISSGSNGDCALSLLSSSAPSSTREFVLNNVVAVQTGTESVLPPHHALLHNYYGGGSTTPTAGTGHYAAYFQEIKPVPSASDSHGSNTSTLHFPEMFQPAPEGSSTGGSHQTLTFTWE